VPDSHPKSDTDANAEPNANAHRDALCDCDTNTESNCNANAHRDALCDCDTDTESNCNADTDAKSDSYTFAPRSGLEYLDPAAG
jgi:serine-aspartate repeat-containing protein C/D/E